MRSLVLFLTILTLVLPARAADYDVGPGQPLAAIADVPWESLMPGDNVRIHWRAQPYREKWVIGRQGTPLAPITVSGVPGPSGELPVISGENATTPLVLDYWNDERGLIKVGGSSVPANTTPEWIIIEGLELRSAHQSYGFSDDRGNASTYAGNAASVYVEVARNLIVRGCVIHDSGNGIFIGSPGGNPSRDILIEGNWIYGNGNVGSQFEHNSYTTTLGITFQDNHYGPLRPGADGNNLKDRSAGLVVRHNWIESGNRQLDLVEDSLGSLIQTDPSYSETHVYGNVLIEAEDAGNRQMIHYGGDSGDEARYRKGTLFLYNNTIISERAGRSTLLRLSSNDESCDARNNVIWLPNANGDQLELVSDTGTLSWSHNWVEPGWSFSFFGTNGTFNDAGTTVEGTDPGFVDAASRVFALLDASALRDAGGALNPLVLPAHDVIREPTSPLLSAPRPTDGMLDIGAFEYASAVSLPGEATDLRLASTGWLTWQGASDASGHDVLRGELMGLAAGGLSASVLDCPATDLSLPEFLDAAALPPSGAAWYLVRGRNAAGVGTWGGSRDAALGGAPGGCSP